ncbi:MAG: histidine phosphatase family protein [Clostridia bacterium]|nr:histidine phosphatase family protein [Clostridia bacterium]
MKLLIIRHGDPNYAIDGLTEKGQREAALLADRLCREEITAVYCSTMGRAKLTIQPTLDRLGITAEYGDWLREFSYVYADPPYEREGHLCWDQLPAYMSEHPTLYSPTAWRQHPVMQAAGAGEAYDAVCHALDTVLEQHGYRRNGCHYDVLEESHKTLVFVCHYGVSGVLLSHLLNCSPYTVWQNMCTVPTAVSTFYTEERVQGIASLRCVGLGDVSHLYAGGEEPSFSARFCECFSDKTRH